MVESTSNNLFLLITSLAQIDNKDLLIRLYTAALNNLFNPIKFQWIEDIEDSETNSIPFRCNNKLFGYILFDQELGSIEYSLFSNSIQMVSVFLERLYQNELLNNRDKHLNKLVEKRTKEISKEKKFNANVINALTDTFYLFDSKTGAAIQWNNAFCEISGYSNEEIAVMKAPDEFYNKEDLEKIAIVFQTVIYEGKANVELNLICKDGRTVPTEYQVSLVPNEENDSIYFISIGRDITDRKKSEKKLKISQERLSLSLEASRASVFERNLKTKEITFSPELFLCLGYEEDEIPATLIEFNKLIHPDDLKNIDDSFHHYLKGYAPYFYSEFKIIDKLGDWIWCSTHGKVVKYDEEGKPLILVGITKDNNFLKVAELAIMQQNDEIASQNEEFQALNSELEESLKQIQLINIDLQKAREKAEESDRLKSAFLANMSHEIRTPMNSILGFSSFLTDDDIDFNSRKKYAALVENSGYYLLRLIDDIIDISKIESNQLNVKLEIEDVSPIFIEIKAMVKNEAKKRKKDQIKIHNKNKCNISNLKCYTDKIRFIQVFMNLLTNALKYTEEGNITFGVSKVMNDFIVFYVSDTGKGIDKQNSELIFERFRQIETEIYREGTGLGLSITRGLVNVLGGKLWVESELNDGSTFYFNMPQK